MKDLALGENLHTCCAFLKSFPFLLNYWTFSLDKSHWFDLFSCSQYLAREDKREIVDEHSMKLVSDLQTIYVNCYSQITSYVIGPFRDILLLKNSEEKEEMLVTRLAIF